MKIYIVTINGNIIGAFSIKETAMLAILAVSPKMAKCADLIGVEIDNYCHSNPHHNCGTEFCFKAEFTKIGEISEPVLVNPTEFRPNIYFNTQPNLAITCTVYYWASSSLGAKCNAEGLREHLIKTDRWPNSLYGWEEMSITL